MSSLNLTPDLFLNVYNAEIKRLQLFICFMMKFTWLVLIYFS